MAETFWFKFYFKDYESDVKPLSLQARGLLMEIIIHLEKNKADRMEYSIPFLIRLTGSDNESLSESLNELKKFAIFSFEEDTEKNKILISRKLSKRILKSKINSENANGKQTKSVNYDVSLSESLNESSNENEKKVLTKHHTDEERIPIFNSNSNSISKSNLKNSVIQKFEIPKEWVYIWDEWKNYRKLKKQRITIEERAFKNLLKVSNHDLELAKKIIDKSIDNDWTGLFPLSENSFKKKKEKINPTNNSDFGKA